MQKQYLSEKEVSKYFGYSRSTLQHWRWKGEGPKFIKIKNKVLYPSSEIESFFGSFKIQQSTSQSTSSKKEVTHD